MRVPVYQLCAFSREPFGGNPASVCILDEWLPSGVMTRIAASNGGTATAFLRDQGGPLAVRFFMAFGELPLVGHASLAAGAVALTRLRPETDRLAIGRGETELVVARERDGAVGMALSAVAPRAAAVGGQLAAALGTTVLDCWTSGNHYFALLEDAAAVAQLTPDMARLMAFDLDSVVATAAGDDDFDFVSRAFAPKEGLPEDPVCGSAHLTLAPYWAGRLGRPRLRARQLSPRGGEILCEMEGEAVRLVGHCATYLEGTIVI